MNKIAKYIVTGACLIVGLLSGVFGIVGTPEGDGPITWAFMGKKAAFILVAWLLLETTKATCPELWQTLRKN